MKLIHHIKLDLILRINIMASAYNEFGGREGSIPLKYTLFPVASLEHIMEYITISSVKFLPDCNLGPSKRILRQLNFQLVLKN